MSKRPALSPEQAIAAIGSPRGNLLMVSTANRGAVRQYFTARGLPALFVAGLAYKALHAAYNDVSDKTFDRLQANAAEAKEADGDTSADAIAAVVDHIEEPTRRAVLTTNGHDASESANESALIEALRNVTRGNGVDAAAVNALIDARLKDHQKTVTIEIHNVETGKRKTLDKRVPPWFERVCKLVQKPHINVLLVGPAGCGKTHTAALVAEALGRALTIVHGSGGVSEGTVNGRLLPIHDNGRFGYVPTPFVTAYAGDDQLICADEVDGFDPNVALCFNAPIANGHMHIAHKLDNPVVTRGERVGFIGTANTFGTGANPIYSARMAQDAAFLDRWTIVEVDYDTELEREIGAAGGLTQAEMDGLWEIRKRTRENNVRRVISTRAFQKAADMKACGDSWSTIKATLLAGWTKDEKAKIGE